MQTACPQFGGLALEHSSKSDKSDNSLEHEKLKLTQYIFQLTTVCDGERSRSAGKPSSADCACLLIEAC